MIELAVKYGGQIVALLAVLAGAFGIYRKGKKDEAVKRDAAEAVAEVKTQAVETSRQIAEIKHEAVVVEGKANAQSDVIGLPIGGAAERLRADWSRD